MAPASDYGAVEWLRSRRVAFGPLYAATPVLVLGALLTLVPVLYAFIAMGALALAAGYWAVTARGWRRPYYLITLACAVGWMLGARLAESLTAWTWVGLAWLCLTVVLAIPWWADTVRRTQVSMEALIRSWPIRARRVGLGGTWLNNVRVTATGWSAMLTWLPGAHTVDEVSRLRQRIEGALELRSGELDMPLDGRSTNSVELVVTTKDPHAHAIPWDVPTEEANGQHVLKRLSARDPIHIGTRVDGTKKYLRVYLPDWGVRQVLIAGVRGSGKSGLLNLLWAHFALCEDIVQWGADLKGGVELGPWRTLFDWTVDTREEAIEMFRAVCVELERRQEYCKKKGWKKWRVDKDHPLLVVSVDEAATLLGNLRQSEMFLFEEISRKARAMGIVVIYATQYPTLDALGSSQVKSQFDQRFCFRLAEDGQERFVIPDHPVSPHKIPSDRPGTCYHLDGDELDRMTMRVLWVDDEGEDNVVAVLVKLLAGYTPTLDDAASETIENAVPAYAEREVFIPGQRDGEIVSRDGRETIGPDGEIVSRDEGGDISPDVEEISPEDLTESEKLSDEQWLRNGDLALAEIVGESPAAEEPERDDPAGKLSPTEARAALVSALKEHEDGIRVSDLQKLTTRRHTWVYDELGALEEQGKVRRCVNGGWTWVGPRLSPV